MVIVGVYASRVKSGKEETDDRFGLASCQSILYFLEDTIFLIIILLMLMLAQKACNRLKALNVTVQA